MAKKSAKTNAIREVETAGIPFGFRTFEADGAPSGVEVAALLGEDPDRVFKTLVTTGKTGDHYVFMIPVAEELDLKKAAQAVGEKAVAMLPLRDLFPLTGYEATVPNDPRRDSSALRHHPLFRWSHRVPTGNGAG